MSSASLKASEPSMEDILASIRRIISDDQDTIRAPEAGEAASSALASVLDMTDRHVSAFSDPHGDEDDPSQAAAEDDVVRQVISTIVGGYEKEQPLPSAGGAKPAPGPRPEEPLLSASADASVTRAFGRLDGLAMPGEPRTVEDLMKEMLRPMLKAWLDDNLPALVERLVQAEIERVTRGRA